jgi:hypothetical protein
MYWYILQIKWEIKKNDNLLLGKINSTPQKIIIDKHGAMVERRLLLKYRGNSGETSPPILFHLS